MLKRQQRAKLYKNGRKKKDNKDCKEKQNICCQEITKTHETAKRGAQRRLVLEGQCFNTTNTCTTESCLKGDL